jgi:hypothetical protein
MNRLVMAAVALGAVAVVCPTASADLVAISGGWTAAGGAWTQSFVERFSVGTFDTVAIRMASEETSLADPYFSNFDHANWWNLPTVSGRFGVAVNYPFVGSDSLQFDTAFQLDRAAPLAFDFVAFKADDLVDSARVSWNGSDWEISHPVDVWSPTRAYIYEIDAFVIRPVPEPTGWAMLLSGAGCLGAVALRRRGRR